MDNFVDKLGKLLMFMCQKYENDATFRAYGEDLFQLIGDSGIDFGYDTAQIEAMELLRKKGYVEVTSPTRIAKVSAVSSVRPTFRGLELVKNNKKSFLSRNWPQALSAITEGVVKGLQK